MGNCIELCGICFVILLFIFLVIVNFILVTSAIAYWNLGDFLSAIAIFIAIIFFNLVLFGCHRALLSVAICALLFLFVCAILLLFTLH